MIGNSIPEYIFIRAAILALRLITPTSFIYLVTCVCYHTPPLSPFFLVLALSEALFFTLIYLPRKRSLQRPPTYKPTPLTKSQRHALFMRCSADLGLAFQNATDVAAPYPRGWFLPKTTSSETRIKIHRKDIVEWLLWALFFSSPEEMRGEWEEELEGYVDAVQRLLGEDHLSDEDGDDGNEVMGKSGVRSMRVTVDEVKMVHRPLIWYMIVCLVDTMTCIRLLLRGFHHYAPHKWFQVFPPRPVLSFMSKKASTTPDIMLPYWYRPHKSLTKLPVLFLHGIGIGLHPYIPFVQDLISHDPDIGILLIEFLPISMHMTPHPVPLSPVLATALNNILESHGIDRIVLVAHSYGTFIGSCILNDSCAAYDVPTPSTLTAPQVQPSLLLQKISHTLLIDPIPLLLHLPPVAYNFLYRHPSSSSLFRNASEWQLWYFASTDPDVARTLGRAFFWTEGVAWREDVRRWMRGGAGAGAGVGEDVGAGEDGEEVVGGRGRSRNLGIILGGRDQIIPSESIWQHLTGGAEVEGTTTTKWVSRGWAFWDDHGDDAIPSTSISESSTGNGILSPSRATIPNGKDRLVYTRSERRVCGDGISEGGDLEVHFHPMLDHATVFETKVRREGMLDVLARYVADY